MSKLERFEEAHPIFRNLDILLVAALLRFFELGDPDFDEAFEFVSSISEVPDRINVERVLAHAYSVRFQLLLLDMHLLVDFLAILLDPLLQLIVKTLRF